MKNEAVAKALLKCYPNELVSLDDMKARIVEAPARVIEEAKEEAKEAVEDVPVMESTPKRKASKKKSK